MPSSLSPLHAGVGDEAEVFEVPPSGQSFEVRAGRGGDRAGGGGGGGAAAT